MKRNTNLQKLMISAILLAVGIVLPFMIGQVQVLGQAISPMHIPALICGLTCGPVYGAAMGFILPLFRSLLFGFPPFPTNAVPMAFELMVYGLGTGLLYPLFRKLLPMKNGKHLSAMLIAMVIAMILGRMAGGAAKAVVLGMQGKAYGFMVFITAYFINTTVGAVIHLIVIPVIVTALEKAGLSPLVKK